MRENGPIVVLVAALLAFLGIRGLSPEGAAPSKGEPKGGQAAASEPGEKEGKEAGDGAPSDEEAAGPLWPALDFQNTGARPDVKEKDQTARGLDVPGWQTRYLIACVPDPEDSSSGYRFDALIDAIQRAAESQNFVLDRYYYPWSHKGPAKASPIPGPFDVGGTLTEEGSGKRALRIAAQSKPSKDPGRTDPKRWPGLLQFRKPPSAPWLLQVFLVGETATAGIHKEAFTASLDLIGKSAKYDRHRMVRVLGPYFSGSQVSLERTLREWTDAQGKNNKAPKTITIISGSATAIDKAKLETCLAPGQVEVEFHATLLPVGKVLKATLRYLGVAASGSSGQLELKHRLAVVCESNTTFGREIGLKVLETGGLDLAFFPFPLRVSEVRSAYQQTSGPTKNDTLTLPSFGSRLRLPLTGGQPRDTEPSLDHAMTAVTTERILGTMFNTIARERFGYALILGSDVKDKLFLASLLRQRCPDTRLILLGSDLLFSHPDFSADLRGTVVGSTYPLYPRNQHWSFPAVSARRPHIVFPGDVEQGYYNAAVALLNPEDPDSLQEYGPPFPHLPTDEMADRRRPPVWISIVGQGGAFPLAAVPSDPEALLALGASTMGLLGSPHEHAQLLAASALFPGRPDPGADYVLLRRAGRTGEGVFRPLHPTLWIILVLGVTLLLAYVFTAYFVAVWGRDRWGEAVADRESGWEMRRLFCPRKDSEEAGRLHWRQRFYAFVCLTSVLVLYSYLTFVWGIPFYYQRVYGEAVVDLQGWNWIAPTVLVSLLVVIGMAFLVLRVTPLSWWAWRRPSRKARPAAVGQPEGNPPGPDPPAAEPGTKTNERYDLVLLIVLSSLLLLSVLAIYYWVHGRPEAKLDVPGEGLLFFERATSLANGVTPVVPIFLLAMAFFCWGYVQLKRLYLLGPPHVVENPFPETAYFKQVNDRHNQLKDDLRFPERALKRTGALVAWVALFFTFSRLASHFVPSVEGVWTESLILLGFAGLSVLIGYTWLHLCRVWKSTRELLDALALLPTGLGEAFQRIPTGITGLFGPYLSSGRPGRQGQSKARLERLNQVARDCERVEGHLPKALNPDVTNRPQEMKEPTAAIPAATLRKVARVCFTLLEHVWSNPALAERFAETPSPKPAEAAPAAPPTAVHVEKTVTPVPGVGSSTQIVEDIEPKPHPDKLVRDWLTRVQDFVALEVTVYLSQFFVHLRNLMLFLTLAPFLMLLAVTSYPFQPQRLWLLLAATLIGVGTATVIWIIIQVERNEVVSHILSTTPNQLNFHWAFLGRILISTVPLIGVIVAASSDASDLVHSLVDPLVQALR
jgi:hypothetical protein